MITSFLSWLYHSVYQLILVVLSGRKPLNDVSPKGKPEEVDVAVSSLTPVVVGSPTPVVVDSASTVLLPIPPALSPKKTVRFEIDERPSPRSPSSRSPTRYADSTTAAETTFGTTQNANGKQRLSFHWRGGNCHEKVKMIKQKPQRQRRGSMHLLGCNKASDKGILSSTDNSLQVNLINTSDQFASLTHLINTSS